MLCLVRYFFVISTSVIDCLGRFVPEMTHCVSSGTLNLTKLKLKLPSYLAKLNVRRSKALTVTVQVAEHHCTLAGTELSWLMTQAHVYTT